MYHWMINNCLNNGKFKHNKLIIFVTYCLITSNNFNINNSNIFTEFWPSHDFIDSGLFFESFSLVLEYWRIEEGKLRHERRPPYWQTLKRASWKEAPENRYPKRSPQMNFSQKGFWKGTFRMKHSKEPLKTACQEHPFRQNLKGIKRIL